VVGGGIAGISTAFFVLRNTSQRVILVEGGQIGHGATGHNGGQLVSYFPRSLQDLVGEFGLEKSAEAHDNIENDAWELLNIMYTEAKLDIALSRFMGHLGLSSKDQLLSVLEDNHLRKTAGLKPKEILIAEHVNFAKELEIKYPDLFRLVSHEEILEKLETKQPRFIACLSEQKGCMNSALFVEKVAEYLLEKYQNRFSLYEHTHISKVVLHDDKVILDADTHTVTAKKVVLCTNGFDSLTIFNKSGLDIDTRFHHSLHAIIGYMSGYLEEPTKPPMAINYLYDDLSGDDSSGAPYIYLTRRAYEYPSGSHLRNGSKYNLKSMRKITNIRNGRAMR
jgi:glycine/D-amino acid oxidase-like deaminating enzyme